MQSALPLAMVAILAGCPTASLKPVSTRLTEGAEVLAELSLSRREACWPDSKDPGAVGGVVTVIARLRLRGEAKARGEWTLRWLKDDRQTMASLVPVPGAAEGEEVRALRLAGGIPPGDYAVVVDVEFSSETRRLRAPFSVVPCVYY